MLQKFILGELPRPCVHLRCSLALIMRAEVVGLCAIRKTSQEAHLSVGEQRRSLNSRFCYISYDGSCLKGEV
jgi:hypothetical protein